MSYNADNELFQCENSGYPKDKNAKRGVYKLNRLDIPRCKFCVGWVKYYVHDYPINVKGEDVTQPKEKPEKVCNAPGHKNTWNKYDTVHFNKEDGISRCMMCSKWRSRNNKND